MGEDADRGRPIRVLLADDHTMFRQGLAGILASYGAMEVVAEVPNDAQVPRLARELRPDAVVMQVQMPFERAKRTLSAMRSFPDPPKVVIVTMLESPRYVRGLTGANAYLLKTSSAEHLIAAVRAADLDPEGGDAVVGMPRSLLEESEVGGDSVIWATLKWCIDAGLPVRMGCGRYDVTDRFSEHLDDLWAAGHEPEADRLQIRDHNDQRDGHRNRGKVKAEPVSKRTTAELERVPDPGIVDALQRFLSRNLQRCDEEPGWFSVALWAEYHLPTKPTPLTVEVALGELHRVTA